MLPTIAWGIGDLIHVLYQRAVEPPLMLLGISDILATFGAFLAVLIRYGCGGTVAGRHLLAHYQANLALALFDYRS